MSILYVGIDLAKNVFAVHGVNGKVRTAELRQPKVNPAKLNARADRVKGEAFVPRHVSVKPSASTPPPATA